MVVLVKPVISEKATNQSELLEQYSFYVNPKANKYQIKDAIEKAYEVDVLKVRTMVVAPDVKTRYTKTGTQIGKTKKLKKAVVQIKEGQEIDLFG